MQWHIRHFLRVRVPNKTSIEREHTQPKTNAIIKEIIWEPNPRHPSPQQLKIKTTVIIKQSNASWDIPIRIKALKQITCRHWRQYKVSIEKVWGILQKWWGL